MSVSLNIMENDIARDLREEYKIAFYYNDVKTALMKIDAYVRSMFDESFSNDWCDYYYSLTFFMWEKGILTQEVRDKAIRMIESGFGLEVYKEAGQKIFDTRKKKLEEFKDKLLYQKNKRKKITIDLYTEPVFNCCDIIALQLTTLDKVCTSEIGIDENVFKQMDGKYIILRKVADYISYTSKIEPSVKNIWPVFQLYKKIFDTVPEIEVMKNTKFAKLQNGAGTFYCEGDLKCFVKRNYKIIGNQKGRLPLLKPHRHLQPVFLKINKPWYNADEIFIKYIAN